jgi:hypothetical protein
MHGKWCASTVAVLVAAALLLPLSGSKARGQEKAHSPRWEFKAAAFSKDEAEGTKKLNDLAAEGWEYVGPLANGLVAFRRPHVPRNHLIVEVTKNPRAVATGEKMTITVTVRDGDRKLLSGAKVSLSTGGGKFLAKADTPFDPKGRLHAPYSAEGTTDQKGQFTTWWVVNPAAGRYGLRIEVSKEGHNSSQSNEVIQIK